MTDEMKPCPEITDEIEKLAARAMQKENRPTHGLFNEEQLDAMDSESLPRYRLLARAALRATIAAWNARAPVQSEGAGDEETWIANLAKQSKEFDAAEERFLTEESESRAARTALSPAPVDPQLQATMDGITAILRSDAQERGRQEGWKEAVEACARVVEQNVVLNHSAGETSLRRRPEGEISNLAYAAAIRALPLPTASTGSEK